MEDMALLIPIIALCIPIVAIWTRHLQRMEEIRSARSAPLSPLVAEELQQLRLEVAALRETTTRFDMSFDAALTRLEDRVEQIETADVTSATDLGPTLKGNQMGRAAYSAPEPVQVFVGRGVS